MRSKSKKKNQNSKKIKILGTVIFKPRKSYILEDKTLNKYKLGEKDLFQVFPGDLVSCYVSSKGWAKIDKTIKSNTHEVLAELRIVNKSWTASPINFGNQFTIKIEGNIPKETTNGSLSKIAIKRQPNSRNPAYGEIISLINNTNIITKATDISIVKNQIREDWPNSVKDDLATLMNSSKNTIDSKRQDLRNKSFITIDGKNAKDFDDAVYAETNDKGNINLYVAIADVAHFIEPNSSIDQEAKTRGTSIYFPEKVIPMLPEYLSNDLCSLKPNKDRYVLVACIEINKKGLAIDAEFFEGVINSKARLIYEDIENEVKENNKNKAYFKSLETLRKIYSLLKKAKLKRGALELDIPQYNPIIKNNKIKNFYTLKREESHLLIEECMLIANICAATILSKSCLSSIYRIHPKPDKNKIKKLEAFLRSRNINIKLSSLVKVNELSKLISDYKDSKNIKILHLQILQTLSLAIYDINASEHYALGHSTYTHFTSPIRRYPDLMVHRALKALLKESNSNKISISKMQETKIKKIYYPYNEEDLRIIASESSNLERKAESASRDTIKTLKCECAIENLNLEFSGEVQAVTNFGLFILVHKLNIEGLCHIKYLPKNEYYSYNETSQSLVSNKSGHSYSLGDKLRVKIKKVDIFAQLIDLEILG